MCDEGRQAVEKFEYCLLRAVYLGLRTFSEHNQK
jgi:hypothetical protein